MPVSPAPQEQIFPAESSRASGSVSCEVPHFAPGSDGSCEGYSLTFPAMGTTVVVTLENRPTTELVKAAKQLVEEDEQRFSSFRSNSEVATLKQCVGSWCEVSDETADLLAQCVRARAVTGGWFDVFAIRGEPAAPIVAGADPIELGSGRARLNFGGIDLGGIAKGYTADRLRDLLVADSSGRTVVSLGSSSISLSRGDGFGGAENTATQPRRNFLVGFLSPWDEVRQIGAVELSGGSLSVSADPGIVRSQGRQSSHLIDPHTGESARTDLAAVAVAGASGVECEIFSSAYLAMGLDRAMELDRGEPDLFTVFMTVDGRILASENGTFKITKTS